MKTSFLPPLKRWVSCLCFDREMGYGIQDFVVDIWRWIRKKPNLDMTYTGTICAHCRKDYRSAYRYDKKELTEDWAKWNHK